MNFLDKNKFPKLNFELYPIKVTKKQKKTLIWDSLRLTWLVLTPEEWVRQHTLNFLITTLNLPKELIKAEHPVCPGTNTCQRIDLLVYNNSAKAHLLVECKAASVKISQSTLDQAIRYNSEVKAKYIMLTNGLSHYFYSLDERGLYQALEDISQINL
ncbi:MAG: type I restriction enzyme HsdR N-terminal domain-containing protein [Rikenellaceae bacterium]